MVARGSCAASWSWCARLLQLGHRQISCEARFPVSLRRRMAFASPLRIAYVHIATRAIARATALLHRKIVSILEYPNVKCLPHVPRCTRLPPAPGGAGQHHVRAIFADSVILCNTFCHSLSFACSLRLVVFECRDSDQS